MNDHNFDDREVWSKIAELEDQLSALKRVVGSPRRPAVPAAEQVSAEVAESETTSRRKWIAGAGAAAAGAVIAVSSGRPAAAADPNDVVKDADNVTSGSTRLTGGRLLVRDTGATPVVNYTAKVGAVADTDTFNGLMGSTRTSAGYGVIAMADRGAGSRAQLILEPNGPPPPTGGGNRPGEIAVDDNGDMWFAVATDAFRKLAGPATAGSLHTIDPVRVFDSRLPAIPNSGIFGPQSNRTISVQDAYDLAGVVSVTDAVPDGATAIVFNVTVTETTGPNFVAVVPGSAAAFATSSINFAAGQTLANGLTVGLDDDRQVKVFCGGGSGSTHVLLDVSGYHL